MIPQLPLVPTCSLSLLDMCTYPEQLPPSDEDAATAAAIATLTVLTARLRVAYLATRNPRGWHSVQQWDSVLSMGEQQALGIVRCVYHRPDFAVLDEATSACAEDVAAEAYSLLGESQIRFVTIAQAADALRKYHQQELRLGEASEDGWALQKLAA